MLYEKLVADVACDQECWVAVAGSVWNEEREKMGSRLTASLRLKSHRHMELGVKLKNTYSLGGHRCPAVLQRCRSRLKGATGKSYASDCSPLSADWNHHWA